MFAGPRAAQQNLDIQEPDAFKAAVVYLDVHVQAP
jgi:hypothetical protein